MILNKICLENWGKFRELTEINFSKGLNILYGPNESGKTTLIDSLRTVFFTKHTSHSEKIKSLVPWGSNLSPKASITFLQNGSCYRITKRFISSEVSLLEKLVNNKWERIAEGDNADKKVIELVGGKLPIRGDTKPEFWGLGQVLWMVQGQPFISEGVNEETLSSLQKLIGATIESDQEKKLFEIINEKFSNIFTQERRDFKKGSEIRNLREKIEELEKSRKEGERVKEEKEELIRKIEDKEILLRKKKEKLKTELEKKKELKEKVDLAYEHQTNREKLEEEVKRISSEYETLKKQINSIKEGKGKIKDIESENNSLEKEKRKLGKTLQNLQGEISEINENISEINEGIELNDDTLRYARIAYDAIQKERELKEKEELLNEMQELEDELLKKQEKAKILKAPSKKEIKRIQEIHQQIHDIRTRLDAIGLTTRIVAKSDISGKIHLDEKSVNFKLKKEEQDTWKSHQTVKILIDKVGDFEIKSGSEDVRKMRTNLEELEIEYEEAVASYATKDIEKLRDLLQQKEEMEKDIKRIKAEIEKRAKGRKEAIKKKVVELKREVKSNWNKIPVGSEFKKYMQYEDKTVSQQELSRRINELERILKNLRRKQKDFNKHHSDLETKREKIKNKLQELEKKIHGNSERIREIRANLEKLEKDGLGINEREKQLNRISLELDKKERARKEYENEIEEMEKKPLKAWEECETRIERLQNDTNELEKEIAKMSGNLSAILRSLKDKNKIEEELEYLKKREQRLLTNAYALELLYDLMHFYRKKTVESLTHPIQKMVTEDLRNLLGSNYSYVKLDEKKIIPVSVGVSDWDKEDASIEVLSFGTKEQIWYLFRLALGRLLSGEEKQLVVLDDPLTNTDASRLHRALQILEERANELQIIVVTCDVDKYNWLSNANFISLEK